MTNDPIQGRGTSWNPPNRFERLEYVADEECPPEEQPAPHTIYLRDPVRTIIARNDSPDVGFAASVNPYRGCEHGCVYCFARPFHEYLGFSAGLDFETKIVVKEDAPKLLRAEPSSPKWEPQVIVMSGVTDCYQPIERTLKLTRGCLEVLADLRNPVGIITKNQLVVRDADILGEMARSGMASVAVSVTSLDESLARILEPRTSAPRLRIEAIRKLAFAGVPVTVLVAPVIPAINDHEIPAILAACASAGAVSAGYVMLRLPHAVAPLFESWLEQHFPDRKEKVLGRVREMRGGKMYDPRWRLRQKGEGVYAEQIRALFGAAARRAGLDRDQPDLRTDLFRRPAPLQRTLFRVTRIETIHAVVRRIPKGKVATYGQIAALAGLPRHARYVGHALRSLPNASPVPWHRVVNAGGRVSCRSHGDNQDLQRTLLEREGVVFDKNGRINMIEWQWDD